MRRKAVWFILVLLVTATTANAQNLKDTIRIKEVKVLARRKVEEAGLKITHLDSLERAATLTTDLSGLISDYSPVFIKSFGRGSTATASFRGAAATHTQVLWNGMNLNSPMRGIADLALLPVFFTDDVYLLHGASSMVEGSGALGGSINLQNQPDWNSKINIRGMVETGSFHTRKSFFKLMVGTGRFKSVTRAFYEASENDFPFFNAGVIPQRRDTLENAAYQKTGVLQEFYYRPVSDRIHSLRLWVQKSNRDLPQLMSYEGSRREEYQKDNQFRLQYEWKKYSDYLNYHFFTGLNSSRLDYYRAIPQFNFVNEDSRSVETSFLNHLRIFRKFDEKTYATLSMDINYYRVNVDDKLKKSGYNENRLETSLMADLHLKPSDLFSAYILMRSENYDKHVVPLIPSAGLEWQFSKKMPLVLRMNAARNYHKPALNDLYWLPGGNPDLLAEDGYTGDISVAGEFPFKNGSFQNEITGFISKIDNWIIWQPAANGAFYWEVNNEKNVLSKGIEYQFSAKAILNEITCRSGGNYSYTSTANQNAVNSVDQSRGKQLIYIPKHKGNVYAGATWNNFTVKYDVNYIGKRYTKSSNAETDYERVLNPYWLNKLTLDKQISLNTWKVNFKFTIENLFNENYQSILWRPMPGRYYNFTVALNYKK